MGLIIILLFSLPVLLIIFDFTKYLITGKRSDYTKVNRVLELISIVGIPMFFLFGFAENSNDCCSESAPFSPEHVLTIYVLIGICTIAYFISSYKKEIISPILETLINSLLLGGIVLNVFIAIQVKIPILWGLGNLPVVLLFILALVKNQKEVAEYSQNFDLDSLNAIEKLSWKILNSTLWIKIPLLLVLCLPILTLLSGFLMLFGQKPDSIIKVFTDTYKHGFSQLDYMCDNVQCGGHFLCSVAANGHKEIVNPTRLGERGGNKIMCNRQLLVANAFEELVEENLPGMHHFIRKNYNKVGAVIHRYYGIFNLKFIADFVYVIMKPLEWFFLVVLYTFDRYPENRIAKQYLSRADRKEIESKTSVGIKLP